MSMIRVCSSASSRRRRRTARRRSSGCRRGPSWRCAGAACLTRSASAGTPTTARTLVAASRSSSTPTSERRCASSSPHRLDVLLRPLLEQAPLERPVEVEHRPVLERLAADQDRLLEDLARHHVDRPADVAVHHVALAVGGRDRRSGRCRGRCRRTGSPLVLRHVASFLSRAWGLASGHSSRCRRTGRVRSAAGSRGRPGAGPPRSFERHDTSARIAGISVATRTMNGARLTPRSTSARVRERQGAGTAPLTASARSLRLVLADVGVDPLEQPPEVGQRVPGVLVLRCGELRQERVVGGPEVVGLDPPCLLVRKPVDVDRDEEVACGGVGEGGALVKGHRLVALARHQHGKALVGQEVAQPQRRRRERSPSPRGCAGRWSRSRARRDPGRARRCVPARARRPDRASRARRNAVHRRTRCLASRHSRGRREAGPGGPAPRTAPPRRRLRPCPAPIPGRARPPARPARGPQGRRRGSPAGAHAAPIDAGSRASDVAPPAAARRWWPGSPAPSGEGAASACDRVPPSNGNGSSSPHPPTQAQGSRLKAQGSRLKAQGSRLKAQGSRLKAQGSRLKAQGSRLKAQGSRLKAQGSRLKAQGSRLRLPLPPLK